LTNSSQPTAIRHHGSVEYQDSVPFCGLI
jgi:hypothetical protein